MRRRRMASLVGPCAVAVVLLLGTLHSWTGPAQVSAYAPLKTGLRGIPGLQSRPVYNLGGLKPRYYQQEAVDLFFQRAEAIRREKGRPMRFQLVGGTGKTAIYTMIAQQTLREKPAARVVIFVPWRALAEQTREKLDVCGLRTCVLGDGCSQVDRSASVVVCVYNSAHRLAGQRFAVKLIDEAHHVEGTGWFTNIMRNNVKADREGDFSATFRCTEVDYNYCFDKAVQDGFLCDLQSSMMPVYANSKQEEFSKLAQLLLQKQEELAPMLLLFNRIEPAREFSRLLNEIGIPSGVVSHRDNRGLRQEQRRAFENGELKALCTVKIFNEGVDVPALRSVILASPRPSSDVGVLQAVMRALRPHASKPDNKASIIQVVNAGSNYTDRFVAKVVRHSLKQISALWQGIGAIESDATELVEKESISRLHLMNPEGVKVEATDSNLWGILDKQGRPRQILERTRKWVWELAGWYRYFGFRPTEKMLKDRDAKETEFRFLTRWKRARKMLQDGGLTPMEFDILDAVGVIEELEGN